MPQGSMWLNPATMKPEVNPVWKSKIERQQAAQATYDVNLPWKQEEMKNKNVIAASNILKTAMTSTRSPIGVQDNKVNAAVHARQLISDSYDPKTGNYNITQLPFNELTELVGSLLSGGTGSSEGRIDALRQNTLYAQYQKAVSYIIAHPTEANSQDMIKQVVGIIDRQGEVSEKLRDNEFNKLKELPVFKRMNLDDEDMDSIKKLNIGTSFKDELAKAPDMQAQKNSFSSEAEAEKADLPPGTIVTINGRRARVK